MNKRLSRLRRAKRTRMKIREKQMTRLCVHKTPRHMYAQVTTSDGAKVLACASTLDKELRAALIKSNKSTGNIEAAKEVGKLLAERAMRAGVSSVAFDRSGFRFHGRIKALADAAREVGLEF